MTRNAIPLQCRMLVTTLFNEEQVKKWQMWCFNELKNTIEKNKKIRDIWLRKKNLLKDFGEDNEKEPI